ncbi:hypothetical protein A8C56_03500 [Niabella ginsenosidivorans]|uniref:Uncharacterized protein n=1 Tax=Niabella ginsenosidivorans TaxID=1176587 RepID=A0A1A9I0B4_9BACT|nr:hypothetical protein A8C56_03500 [Niabella ginsenosidivorans]
MNSRPVAGIKMQQSIHLYGCSYVLFYDLLDKTGKQEKRVVKKRVFYKKRRKQNFLFINTWF